MAKREDVSQEFGAGETGSSSGQSQSITTRNIPDAAQAIQLAQATTGDQQQFNLPNATVIATFTSTERGARIELPPGTAIDQVFIKDGNLYLIQPDGSVVVIVDGAANYPTLVIGDGLEIPADRLAEALENAVEGVPTAGPEAGPDPSGGGNFAVDPGPIGGPFDLRDLLPPTALAFDLFATEDEEDELEEEDAPVIGDVGMVIIEEDDLAGQGNDTDGSGFALFTGSATLGVDFGSSGPGSIIFPASITAPEGFTSNGEQITLVVSGDGLTLQGFAGGNLIFEAVLSDDFGANPNGLITFTLFDNLDHGTPTKDGVDGSTANFPINLNDEEILEINIEFEAENGAGLTANGVVQVKVQDDIPEIMLPNQEKCVHIVLDKGVIIERTEEEPEEPEEPVDIELSVLNENGFEGPDPSDLLYKIPEGVKELHIEITDIMSDAGFENAFGYYFADIDGNPLSGFIMEDNAKSDDEEEAWILAEDIPEGAFMLGFFMLPDANDLQDLPEDIPVTFQLVDGNWVAFANGEPIQTAQGHVLFSDRRFNPTNEDIPDGDFEKMGPNDEFSKDSNWEDKVENSDTDFNDVQFNITVKAVVNVEFLLQVDEDDINNFDPNHPFDGDGIEGSTGTSPNDNDGDGSFTGFPISNSEGPAVAHANLGIKWGSDDGNMEPSEIEGEESLVPGEDDGTEFFEFSAVDTTADTISFTATDDFKHDFVNGEKVVYTTDDPTDPSTFIGGLTPGVYYVHVLDDETIQLMTSQSDALAGVNPVDLTGLDADGTQFLHKVGDRSVIFDPDIDGTEASYAYPDGSTSPLMSKGEQVIYQLVDDGTKLIAFVDGKGFGEPQIEFVSDDYPYGEGDGVFDPNPESGDRLVFEAELSDLGDGEIWFKLYDQIDHPDPGAGNMGDPVEDLIWLKLPFIATDSDGDMIMETLTVDVKDDVPMLTEEPVMLLIDEDDINNFDPDFNPNGDDDGIEGSMGQEPNDGDGDGSFTGNPISNDEGPAIASASLASVVKIGSDETENGGGIFSFVNEDDARAYLEGLGLESKGGPISFDFNTPGEITGFVNNNNIFPAQSFDPEFGDRLVFRLTLDSNGDVTFELFDQMDHDPPFDTDPPGFENDDDPNFPGNTDTADQNTDLIDNDDPDGSPRDFDISTIDFGQIIKVSDFDGDTITLDGQFGVTIRDDIPVLTDEKPVMLLVDEDDINNFDPEHNDDEDGIEGSMGTSPNDGNSDGSFTGNPISDDEGPAIASASLAGLVKVGADETENGGAMFMFIDEGDARDYLENLGLSSKGERLSFDFDDGVVTGFVQTGGGGTGFTSFDPENGDRLVFKLSVETDGDVTFELFDQMDHDPPFDTDPPGFPSDPVPQPGDNPPLADQNTDLIDNDDPDGSPRDFDVSKIDFGAIIKAVDEDGDAVVLDGQFGVTIRDDIPELIDQVKLVKGEGLDQYDVNPKDLVFAITPGTDLEINITNMMENAGFENALGYYFADADGNPISGHIIEDDIDSDGDGIEGAVINGADIPPNAVMLGFFILPDADNKDIGRNIPENVDVVFKEVGGFWQAFFNESDTDPIETAEGFVLFSDRRLNPDIDLDGNGAPGDDFELMGPMDDVTTPDGTKVDLEKDSNWEDTAGTPGDPSDQDYDDLQFDVMVFAKNMVMITVDEDDIDTFGDGLPGGSKGTSIDDGPGDGSFTGDPNVEDGDSPGADGPANASGSLAGLVKSGADEELTFSFIDSDDVREYLDDLGLSSKGERLVYDLSDPGKIIGFVNDPPNPDAMFLNAGDRPVFELTLNEDGEFVFRLFDQMDHDPPYDVNPSGFPSQDDDNFPGNSENADQNTDLIDNDDPDGSPRDFDISGIDFGAIIQATDFDGDSVILDGRVVVKIRDDIPELTGEMEMKIVNEDDILTPWSQGTSPHFGVNNDPENDGDDSRTVDLPGPANPAQVTGTLAGLVAAGADEPLTFGFSENIVEFFEGLGLFSKQTALPENGLNLVYETAEFGDFVFFTAREPDTLGPGDTGNPVFQLRLNTETGAYRFRLFDELIHKAPDSGADENFELRSGDNGDVIDALPFGSVITVTDFDGDSITLDEAFSIKILDDVPEVSIRLKSGQATTHDETPGNQSLGGADDTNAAAVQNLFSALTNTGDDPDVPGTGAIGFARDDDPLVVVSGVDVGADAPPLDGGSLSLEISDTDSGLFTTEGHPIVLEKVDGLVVGRVSGGPFDGQIAFALAIEPSGHVSIAQYLSIWHDDRGDFNENNDNGNDNRDADPDDDPNPVQQNLAGKIEAVVSVTDSDGDTVQASVDIGARVRFFDDGPSIKSMAMDTVDEDDFGEGTVETNVVLAATSFENEASPGGSQTFGVTDATNGATVDLVNQPGERPVDSTTGPGELGYDATWTDSLPINFTGISSDAVGISSSTGIVGSYDDGTQGYVIQDVDGTYNLTFDTIDIPDGASGLNLSVAYFIDGASYESDDFLRMIVETDVGNFTFLNISGDFGSAEEQWNTATVTIPDAATMATLRIEARNTSDSEIYYIDNVRLVADTVVTPATVATTIDLADPSVVMFGADGPADGGGITLKDDVSALESLNLTADGDDLEYNVDGNTLTASADGRTIFTVVVSADGEATYTQFEEIDQAGDEDDPLELVFGFNATDGDGDAVMGTFKVKVIDSNEFPMILSVENSEVDEDGLQGANPDGNPLLRPGETDSTENNVDNVNTLIVVDFKDDNEIPADLDASFAFKTDGLDAQGLMTLNGDPITFAIAPNGDLVGSTANVDPVITISLTDATLAVGTTEVTYQYTVTLHEPIKHPNNDNEDSVFLNNVGFSVTDGNQADMVMGTFDVEIVDDIPFVNVALIDDADHPVIALDETVGAERFADGESESGVGPDGPADDTGSSAADPTGTTPFGSTTAVTAQLFNTSQMSAGADGLGSSSEVFSLVMTNATSGLSVTELPGIDIADPAITFVQVSPTVIEGRFDQTGGDVNEGVALRFTINPGTGEITAEQFMPISHPNEALFDEEISPNSGTIAVKLEKTITDGDGDTVSDAEMADISSFITIDDDGPIAKNDKVEVPEPGTELSDVVLIVDRSGSMGPAGNGQGGSDPDGAGPFTSRLEVLQAAVQDLFNSGTVNSVFIVSFASDAEFHDSGVNGGWYTNLTDALAVINGFTADGSTDYDAAVEAVTDNFTAPPAGGDKLVSMFLSDGEPNQTNGTGSDGIDEDDTNDPPVGVGEETAWINFLNNNSFDESFAFGFGGLSADDIGELEPIAWTPGEIAATYDADNNADAALDENVILVTDISDLSDELIGSISPSVVSGNVLANDMPGSDGLEGIVSITVQTEADPDVFVTFTFDGTDIKNETTNAVTSGSELVVETAFGGKFTFYFADDGPNSAGDFSYMAGPVDQDVWDKFDYTIVDGDGDESTATLTIDVINSPPDIAVSNVEVEEGEDAVFEITLSEAASGTVNVDLTLNDGTAEDSTGDNDYDETSLMFSTDGGSTFSPVVSGSIAITAGQTSVLVKVSTNEDTDIEPDEDFTLTATVTSGNTSNTDDTGTGTILNDDSAPPVLALNEFGTVTTNGQYRDEFGSSSYSNSDGTTDWSGTPWQEGGGESGNDPNNGDIEVTGGRLRFDRRIDGGETIERDIDLSGATSATLSFDYEDDDLDNGENVVIEAWNGSSWDVLGTLGGGNPDGTFSFSQALTAAQMGPDAAIRFRAEGDWENGENFFIDNVNIAFTAENTVTVPSTDFGTTFTENGPAVSIAAAGPTITDPDDTNMESATITLTNPQAGDLLSVNPGDLPAGISIDGTSTATNIILTGSASLSDYQDAIQAVTFSNGLPNPDNTDRTIDVVVNDGAVDSNTATTTIKVFDSFTPALPTARNQLEQDETLDSSGEQQTFTKTVAGNPTGPAQLQLLMKGDYGSPASETVTVTVDGIVLGTFRPNGTALGSPAVAVGATAEGVTDITGAATVAGGSAEVTWNLGISLSAELVQQLVADGEIEITIDNSGTVGGGGFFGTGDFYGFRMLFDGFASDPIVIDLDGDGVELAALDEGVNFDIDADGQAELTAWAKGGDGILAIDLDGSGAIEDGTEIFTPDFNGGEFSDAMDALASLDSNGDGVIDVNDDAFEDLVIWVDANGDGVSQASELTSLTANGIESIDLNVVSVDYELNGQQIVAEGLINLADGGSLDYVAADFDMAELPPAVVAADAIAKTPITATRSVEANVSNGNLMFTFIAAALTSEFISALSFTLPANAAIDPEQITVTLASGEEIDVDVTVEDGADEDTVTLILPDQVITEGDSIQVNFETDEAVDTGPVIEPGRVRFSATFEDDETIDGEAEVGADGSGSGIASAELVIGQQIVGTDGDDILIGGEGDDILVGGEGDDILIGGAGDDILKGGAGENTLTGGEGADTFVLESIDIADIITDYSFEDGDMVDISALLDGAAEGTNVADNLENYVRVVTEDGKDEASLEVDTAGGGDAFTKIATLHGIGSGDVVKVILDDGDNGGSSGNVTV